MSDRLHLESFLEMMSVERGSSPNTLESYRRDLEAFCEGIKSSADSCTHQEIVKYTQSLAGKGFSASSRARKLSSLKQFFKYLYIEKIRTDNPTSNIDAPKKNKSLPKFLTEKEVDKLLEVATKDIRLKAMLEVLYAAGLRVSELISLKNTSIRKEGEDHYLIVKGKGNKERMVPLTRLAIEAVEKQKSAMAAEKSEWLFPSLKFNNYTTHITRQGFAQLLKEMAGEAGIDPNKLSPHVLRHSFASHLLHHGAALRLVQELLGHKQIATTQIYTHIQSTKLHELVENHHPLAKI